MPLEHWALSASPPKTAHPNVPYNYAPVTFGAFNSDRGTSQRPGAPILVRRMYGEMFSTVSVRLEMSVPNSGSDPLPRSESSPINPLSAPATRC